MAAPTHTCTKNNYVCHKTDKQTQVTVDFASKYYSTVSPVEIHIWVASKRLNQS